MPELTDEQTKNLLKNAIPFSLNVNKEDLEKALKECDEYIKTGNKILMI